MMAQFSYKSELVSFSCACSRTDCCTSCSRPKLEEVYKQEELLKFKPEFELRPQYKRERNKKRK